MEPRFVGSESLALDHAGQKPRVALGLQIEDQYHGLQDQQRTVNDPQDASASRVAISSSTCPPAAVPGNLRLASSDGTPVIVAHQFDAGASMRIPISYADSLRCAGRAQLEQLSAWRASEDEASSYKPDVKSLAFLESKPDERCYRSSGTACADPGNLADALQEELKRLDDELEVALQELSAIQSRTKCIAAAMSQLDAQRNGPSVVPGNDNTIWLGLEVKFRQCQSLSEGIVQALRCSSESSIAKCSEG